MKDEDVNDHFFGHLSLVCLKDNSHTQSFFLEII